MPKFSVIIPNWNGMKFLKTCLDSLHAQSFRDFEAVLVDNGSSDGSLEFVKSHYPEVIAVPLEKNLGFSRAVNQGIRQSSGEIIALLNNDTEADPGWLEALDAFLGRHPDFGLVASRVMFMDSRDVIDSAGDAYTMWGAVFNRGHGEKYSEKFAHEEEVFGVCASAAAVRRTVLDDIGLLEEAFFAYYEDVELSFRARLAGWKCGYCPEAVVYHSYSASTSGAVSKLGREEVYIYLTFVWIKNMPVKLMLSCIGSAALFHSMIFAFFIIARIRGKALMPRVPFIHLLRHMLANRKDIKLLVKTSPSSIRPFFLKLGFFDFIRSEISSRR